MAIDWAAAIVEARRSGVDLTADMSEADWAEYRAQSRAWLETDAGEAHRQRVRGHVAARQAIVDEAS